MKFPHFMATLAVLLATLGVGAAQTSSPCQLVSVEASPADTIAGTPVTFDAKLNTKNPTAKPEFRWQITAGKVTAGEGTSSITVDTEGLGGTSVHATVSVSGVSTVCSTSATNSVRIFDEPARGIVFDDLATLSLKMRMSGSMTLLFS